MKTNIIYLDEFKATDSGRYGKALERALTGRGFVRPAGRVDWTFHGKRVEIKQGAGELGEQDGRLVKGVSLVLYVPVVESTMVNGREAVVLENQEGFLLTRDEFLAALEEAGAIRYGKRPTTGVRKTTIQTFWNRKEGKPHGSLYQRMLDALYEHCTETLEEFLENE
jgi:hypothetical protein